MDEKCFKAKKYCKFYKDRNTCTALKKMYCKTEKCKFYKNKLFEVKKN